MFSRQNKITSCWGDMQKRMLSILCHLTKDLTADYLNITFSTLKAAPSPWDEKVNTSIGIYSEVAAVGAAGSPDHPVHYYLTGMAIQGRCPWQVPFVGPRRLPDNPTNSAVGYF